MRRKIKEPDHPLTPFVIHLYQSGKTTVLDGTQLSHLMDGPFHPIAAITHFRNYAVKVLDNMVDNGYLYRDGHGWYRMVDKRLDSHAEPPNPILSQCPRQVMR